MKILHITGNGEYEAQHFFDSSLYRGLGELYGLYEQAVAQDNHEVILEIEGRPVWVKALEFTTTDPAFVRYIEDSIADRDSCRHTNFIVVEY